MRNNCNLEYFLSKKWSFVLLKGGKILYKSKRSGLEPLIICLRKYRVQMRGATVYDKIVGRAAALLLVQGGVKKVFTPLISRGGLAVLRRGGAAVKYKKAVARILNRAGTDLCRMEKLSAGKSCEEFLGILEKVKTIIQ